MDRYTTLIQPQQLAPHLADARWVTFDCRFDLADPQAGRRAYLAGHVPGAHYTHLDEDLAGPVTATRGRRPLLPPGALASRLGQWGVGNDSQVVVYDGATGAI